MPDDVAAARPDPDIHAIRADTLRRLGHSLRTPLNAISASVQLVLATELSEDQRLNLETIEGASDSLLGVVGDLLDAAEIQAGELQVSSQPFRLPDTIREAVRSVRPLAVDRGLELTTHGLSSLPTDLIGDPGRLRQVIVQLTTNAIRFTSHGRVQVGAKVLSHDERAVTIRFAVRDTGIGIPTAELGRIFEPFVQVDADRGDRIPTSGLGLAIACRVVEAMGGDRIEVESEEGRGSTFSFDLRFERYAPEPGEPLRESLAANWIVVVTDDARVGHNLTDALRHGGFESTEFSSIPLAAASVALSDDPSLLPGVVVLAPSDEPFVAAARMRSDPRLGKVPAVLVVPFGTRGDAAECARIGIEGYLPQPVSAVDLIEATRAVLVRGRGDPTLVTRHWLREQRRPLRILVVDDSPTGRAVVMRSLERLGHDTESAPTGRDGLAMLEKGTYDVVLMDMEMPDMDGVEVTKAIRDGGSDIPIVGISAHAFGADRRRCLEAGMDDHITKPFRIEQLQMSMERVLADTR